MVKQKKYSSLKIIIKLLPYVWTKRIRMQIFALLIITLLMVVLNLSIPLVFKNIVNLLSDSQNHSIWFISAILASYGLSWILSQFIIPIQGLIVFRVLEHSKRNLSSATLDHLLSLSMRFHLDRYTGAITSFIERAQSGLDAIFWGLVSFLIPILFEMILAISLISYLYGLSYGYILLIVMTSYLAFSVIAMNRAIKAQIIHNQKRAKSSSNIVDSLLNIETVKYFNNEEYEHKQADIIFEQQESSGVQQSIISAQVQISQATIIGIGLAYLTWMSGRAVYGGSMNIGDFVFINGYIIQFTIPLNQFGYMIHQLRKGINDMSSVMEILDTKPEIKDSPNAITLITSKPKIVFENVYFGYQPERTILKRVSFSIQSGKTLAIIGPTGSGKSSISRLLFRFYDVNSGSIKINDYDIRNVTQKSLHKTIGIVPQDIVLFNNSLYHNIAYGNPNASKKDVEKVIELAHLDLFIRSLPDGYNTVVGERGLKLSGGEKQRVAIARALLKNPQIFIFDEATSSLDSNTEQEIQKNLNTISENTTTIIIAHRLSTITKADNIIMLDDGKVIEQGTHIQMLEFNGLYSELWNKQRLN